MVTFKWPKKKNKESCNHNKMLILLNILNPLCLNHILNVPLSWNPICIHGFFILWNRWQLFLCWLTFNSECSHFLLLNLCLVKKCYNTMGYKHTVCMIEPLYSYASNQEHAQMIIFVMLYFTWVEHPFFGWLADVCLTIMAGHIWTNI